jgi:hypothetical protein
VYPGGSREGESSFVAFSLTNRSAFDITGDFMFEIVSLDTNEANFVWMASNVTLQKGGKTYWPRIMSENVIPALYNDCLTLRVTLTLKGMAALPSPLSKEAKSYSYSGAAAVTEELLALANSEAGGCDFHFVVPVRIDGAEYNGDETNRGLCVRVPVHKLILAARSPVFRAMLSSGMKESCANEVVMVDVCVDAVKAFVRFLYTDGCKRAVLEVHGWDLLALADKYDITALRCMCETYLAEHMLPCTALATLQSAEHSNAPMLKSRAMDFVVANLKTVAKEPLRLEDLGVDLLSEVLRAVAISR